MSDKNDLLDDLFLEEGKPYQPCSKFWKVLVVDDDDGIHQVTSLVCKPIVCLGRGIELIHAYSAAEAEEKLRENPDTAVIFLDVVMESDTAGLDFVAVVRKKLKNKAVRIVLRTGQPGDAPELNIITSYDINDYKEKSDLTTQKLQSVLFNCIKSYRDICTIENTKNQLLEIIKSTTFLYKQTNIQQFALNVLKQLTNLLHLGSDAIYFRVGGKPLDQDALGYELVVGVGKYEKYNEISDKYIKEKIFNKIKEASETHDHLFFKSHYIAYLCCKSGVEHMLYVEGCDHERMSEDDKYLLSVFCEHVARAYDTVPEDEDSAE